MRLLAQLGTLGFILALVGCSSSSKNTAAAAPSGPGGNCSTSSVLGTYSGENEGYSDTLTFNSNCTGTSSLCQSSFTYTATYGSAGPLTINITQSAYDSFPCPSVGQNIYSFQLSGNQMSLTGGDSVYGASYNKQ